VARKQGKPLTDAQVKASVTLNQNDQGGFTLSAELQVTGTGLPQAEVQALAEAAHQVCPYSIATRGNMDVKISAA
jgi:osmotically inducible protein OsmC